MGTDLVVMIVEDDATTLLLAQFILEQQGYRVVSWRTGHGAYAQIQQRQPQLVLLDLHLEELNAGWNVLQQLRQKGTTKNIPVILYTSDDEFLRRERHVLRALRCDTLKKPFTFAALGDKVAAGIGRHTDGA